MWELHSRHEHTPRELVLARSADQGDGDGNGTAAGAPCALHPSACRRGTAMLLAGEVVERKLHRGECMDAEPAPSFLGLPDDGHRKLPKRDETRSNNGAVLHLMISQPRSEILRILLTRLRRLKRFKFKKRGIRNVRRMNPEALEHPPLTSEMRSVLEDAFTTDVDILSRIFDRDLHSVWFGKRSPSGGRGLCWSNQVVYLLLFAGGLSANPWYRRGLDTTYTALINEWGF